MLDSGSVVFSTIFPILLLTRATKDFRETSKKPPRLEILEDMLENELQPTRRVPGGFGVANPRFGAEPLQMCLWGREFLNVEGGQLYLSCTYFTFTTFLE